MTVLQRDATDLRDQIYLPSLRLLRPESDPGGFSSQICPAEGCPPYPLRDQRSDGLCVGFALANLIDIHRTRAVESVAEKKEMLRQRVSARMIYDMARRIEGRSDSSDAGVQSLRSAVKGFYHYGCCPEDLWPDVDDPSAVISHAREIERFKTAQGITLGAYYRVRPFLNDYHSALVEADGILVSAEIHEGWKAAHLSDRDAAGELCGRIPPSSAGIGAHAFVIVGYNSEGFLVLNSWGGRWGGYRKHPGIALWSYADWARTVMDAWVVRLGVPAPGAFQFSVGDQGISFGSADIRAGSTACHYLLGHFAHLDDGRHVESGAYASSRKSVEMTTDMLRDRDPRRRGCVLLAIGGSLLGLKEAFDFEARRRQQVEDVAGLYPYSVLWCTDLIESATPVLTQMFQTAVDRVGPHSAKLNEEIEKVAAGIGRAFWREVRRAARTAGRHGRAGEAGAAADLLDRFAATGAKLHLLVDGAGVMLLAEYLHSLRELDLRDQAEVNRRKKLAEQFYDAVASIDLVAPTMELRSARAEEDFVSTFGPLIKRLNGKGKDRATLWVPAADFEDRLSIDHYAASMLDLVLRSFEGRRDATYVGMSRRRSRIGRLLGAGKPLDGLRVRDIHPHVKGRRRYEYHEVSLNPACNAEILRNVAEIDSASARP